MFKESTLQDIVNKPKRSDRAHRQGTKTIKYIARPSGNYTTYSDE